MVVVVDMHMGWVKKKLWITLPTLLHGVSPCKRIGGRVAYFLRGVSVEMEGGGGMWCWWWWWWWWIFT